MKSIFVTEAVIAKREAITGPATTTAVIARLDRAIQYAAASRVEHWRLWNTGSPAFAEDDNGECCAIPTAVIASASEAIQLSLRRSRKLDCFRLRSLSYGGHVVADAPRNDVDRYESAFSRRESPEFCIYLSPPEGAGNAGRAMPRSLACKNKKHTSIVTTVTSGSPDIPRAMVYGLSRALPGEPRSVATVAGG
jgi:hypothetical protein